MAERARGSRVAAGVATVVLLALGACATGDGPTSAGPAPTPVSTSTTAAPADAPDAADPGVRAPSEVEVRDATLGAATGADAQAKRAPTQIRYDRIGLSMPVDAVGVADDGQMEIPADALRAGWYEYGPGVGADAGTTVLAAHSGSYITPRGPFFDLRLARTGDMVDLDGPDGETVRYRVTDVETIAKDTIDLVPYFARDGDPRLVLITCGGVWDEGAQSYESNVVVTAVPTSD